MWFTGGEGGSRRLLIGKANLAFLKASVQADVQAAVGCHFAEGFAVAGATLGGGGSRPEGQTGLCEKAVDRRTRVVGSSRGRGVRGRAPGRSGRGCRRATPRRARDGTTPAVGGGCSQQTRTGSSPPARRFGPGCWGRDWRCSQAKNRPPFEGLIPDSRVPLPGRFVTAFGRTRGV